MLLPQEGHRVLCKPLKTFLGLVKKSVFFDIFLNNFGKKFNMFGIFCNNKLVKKPICLVKEAVPKFMSSEIVPAL